MLSDGSKTGELNTYALLSLAGAGGCLALYGTDAVVYGAVALPAGYWLAITMQAHDVIPKALAALRGWKPRRRQRITRKPYDVLLGHEVDTGTPVIGNLAHMKSIALWAINGGGKTTELHAIVAGLAATHTKEQLQIAISDLKDGMDFSIFQALPHLFCPVAKTPEETLRLIQMVKDETARRARLFNAAATAGGFRRLVNDLDRYHQVVRDGALGLPPLPRLVVVFDEISTFTRETDTLNLLIDIAEKGRAYGVHLIASTQLPKVDSIPRNFKSQLNSRLVGLMASEADYYQVCDIRKEVYQTRKLNRGEWFVSLGGGEYRIMKGLYIPDAELERIAHEITAGGKAPEWPAQLGAIPMKQKESWTGKTAEQKIAAIRAMAVELGRRPTVGEFLDRVEASPRTADTWIPKAMEGFDL